MKFTSVILLALISITQNSALAYPPGERSLLQKLKTLEEKVDAGRMSTQTLDQFKTNLNALLSQGSFTSPAWSYLFHLIARKPGPMVTVNPTVLEGKPLDTLSDETVKAISNNYSEFERPSQSILKGTLVQYLMDFIQSGREISETDIGFFEVLLNSVYYPGDREISPLLKKLFSSSHLTRLYFLHLYRIVGARIMTGPSKEKFEISFLATEAELNKIMRARYITEALGTVRDALRSKSDHPFGKTSETQLERLAEIKEFLDSKEPKKILLALDIVQLLLEQDRWGLLDHKALELATRKHPSDSEINSRADEIRKTLASKDYVPRTFSAEQKEFIAELEKNGKDLLTKDNMRRKLTVLIQPGDAKDLANSVKILELAHEAGLNLATVEPQILSLQNMARTVDNQNLFLRLGLVSLSAGLETCQLHFEFIQHFGIQAN